MTMTESLHREPRPTRVGVVPLAIGLVGAPAFWVTQLILNYALSSYSCYPFMTELAAPAAGWKNIWIEVLIINAVMLAAAIASTFLSYRNWRTMASEHPDQRDDLVEASEGRARFIALCGALTGLGFILGIVLDLISVLGSPICSIG